MKGLIAEFNETGSCKVDLDKVASAWSDSFSISQWEDKYTLVEHGEDGECEGKVGISIDQAKQIIGRLGLLPIQSGLFRSAKTWRTESNIISEKDRIQGIINDKIRELEVLRSVINEFEAALSKK